MLEFFSEHKRASGVISIFLCILLLPLYSLVALLVEDGRIQSAKQQLSELTYLGEMAILADYIVYLNDNYDLYAFDGTKADAAFQGYIQSATTAGGVNTKSLNTLFGLDIENCKVDKMYSLADPAVMKYQIVQTGLYSMPVEVLMDLTLRGLIESLNKKFEDVLKFWKRAEKVTEAAKNITDQIPSIGNLYNAAKELKTLKEEYEAALDDYIAEKEKIKNNLDIIDQSDFDTMYAELSSDKYQKIQNVKNKYTAVKALIGSDEAMDHIFSSSQDKKKLNAADVGFLSALGFEEFSIGQEIEWSALANRVLDKLAEFERTNDTDYKVGGAVIGDKDDLSRYMNDIGSKLTQISTYENNFGSFKTKVDAIANSELKAKFDALSTAATKMNNQYGTYVSALDDMVTKLKILGDSVTELTNMNKELTQESTDQKATDKAAPYVAKNDEYLDMINNKGYDKNSPEVQKVRQEYLDLYNESQASYKEATKGDGDIGKIGSSMLNSVVSSISAEATARWKENLSHDIEKLQECSIPEINSSVSADEFKSSVKKVRDTDLNIFAADKLLKETGQNIGEAFENLYGKSVEETNKEIIDIEKRYDEAIRQKKEDFDGTGSGNAENIIKWYQQIDDPNSLFAPNNELDDYDLGNDIRPAYYMSLASTLAIQAFMIADIAGEQALNKKDKNSIWNKLEVILGLIRNIFPADPLLNNIVNLDQLPSSDNQQTLVLAERQYEETRRTEAYNYVKAKTAAGFIDSAEEPYYITGDVKTSAADAAQEKIGRGFIKLQSAMNKFEEANESLNDGLKGNFFKLLHAFRKYLEAIVDLVTGLIELVTGFVEFIVSFFTDTAGFLRLMVDNLYISHYVTTHFKCRQNYDQFLSSQSGLSSSVLSNILELQRLFNGKDEYGDCFDGADLEYLLVGNKSEQKNQSTAYTWIFIIRLILNIPAVINNAAIQGVADAVGSVTFGVGAVIVYIVADAIETWSDMTMMLSGLKIPLIKDKVNFFDPDFWTALTEYIASIGTDSTDLSFEKSEQVGSKGQWRYTRKAAANSESAKLKTFKEKSQTGEKVTFETKYFAITEKGIVMDYTAYLNFIMLFYPISVKCMRIGDLVQMHYQNDKDTNFQLRNCYTYVGFDSGSGENGIVHYKSWLPLYMDRQKYDFSLLPPIREVQYNGY